MIAALMAGAFYAGLEYHGRIYAQPVPAQEEAQETEESAEESKSEEKEEKEEKEEEAKEESEENEAGGTSLLDLFLAGGPFMYPLALASIIGLMIFAERVYFFFTNKMTAKTFEQDLIDSLQVDGDKIASARTVLSKYEDYSISKILTEGMAVSENQPDNFARGVEREAGGYIAQAERGLPVLSAISTIAPLIGFLGTVSGMIGAFDAIANADTVNAKVVAGGIKEALITTATGLIVAIPVMTAFQYFQNRINGFATDVEQAANHIYKELLRLSGRTGS